MNKIFEKFLELKNIYKYCIIVAFWFVLYVVIFFLVINPQFSKIKQKKLEYLRVKKKTSMIVKVQKRLNKFKQQFKNVKEQYNIAIKKLPNTREIPNLLLKISSYGKENNLNFLLFKPNKEIQKEFYAIIPISLKFKGSYVETGNFFYEIGKTTRIVKIRNFTITRIKNNSLYINANLETYKFVKNAKNKKKKRKKKK